MIDNTKARAALVAAVVATTLGVAGVASAQDGPRTATSTAAAAPVSTTDRGAQLEHQAGIVLEGSGSAGDLSASVTVYENSLHGNSVQVVLGDDLVGYTEGTAAYVVDGVLHATVDVAGKEAVVSGTLTESGRPKKLTEPLQDNGEQVVTQGTQTQLVGDVTLTYDGVVVPLDLAPAFAYDLQVRRIALYGG